MTWAFSRDDVEGAFFAPYIDKGVFGVSPFETIDRDGVGRLIKIAVAEGRATRPGLTLGICGEHGGDPESVAYCHRIGLTYVSCSPYRTLTARLAAAQAGAADKLQIEGGRTK
jgi:pyruvate,orthophosphate dikinase